MRTVAILLLLFGALSATAQRSSPNRRLNFRPAPAPSGPTLGTNGISVNTLTSYANTSNNTVYISPSFTPTFTNSLLVAELAFSPTGTVTFTNTGTTQLTWWLALTTNYNTTASPTMQHDVWVTQLPQGTAPFAMTCVAKFGSGTGINMHVLEFSGTAQTVAFGTNAILQSVGRGSNTIVGMSVPISAPGNGGFDTLLGGFADSVNSTSDNAAGNGATEIVETSYTTPACALTTQYRLVSPSSVVMMTNSGSSRSWGASVIEIRAGTNSITPDGNCNTLAHTTTGTTSATDGLGNAGNTTYVATDFVATNSFIPCSCVARLKKTGSPTFTLAASVWTYTPQGPGNIIGGWSSEVNVSSLTTSEGDFTLTGMTSGLLTANVRYCYVLRATGSPNDGANFINWAGFTSSGFTEWNSTDGITWGVYNVGFNDKFTLNK